MLAIIGALASLCFVIASAWAFLRWVWPFIQQVWQFLQDWNGRPARPGIVESTPGVMQRLTTQDRMLVQHGALLAEIQAEVNYDHGGSLKDQVRTLTHDVSSLHDKMDKHIESS